MKNSNNFSINRTNKKMFWLASFLGIGAATCWVVADIMLVGFNSPVGINTLIENEIVTGNYIPIVSLMVGNSTDRLLNGTMMACFSAPLLLLAVYHIYFTLRLSGYGKPLLVSAFFIIGFCFYPLAHASFFFLVENYKALNISEFTSQNQQFVLNNNSFLDVLLANWFGAFVFSFIGWFWYFIIMLKKKKFFSRKELFFTPPVMFFLIYIAASFCSDYLSSAIRAASGSLSILVFFAASTYFNVKKDTESQVQPIVQPI